MNRLLALVSCLSLCPLALHAVQVQIDSNPAGAAVRILDAEATPQKGKPSQWVTPARPDLARNRPDQPYRLEFSKDGYETTVVSLDVRGRPTPLSVTLPQLVFTKEVEVTSEPADAEVVLLGETLGRTPLRARLRFERANSRASWSTADLRFRLEHHQDETVTLEQDPAQAAVHAGLARLFDERELTVVATTLDGAAIENAVVEVDGQRAGETPARVRLPFRRVNKVSPWNEFTVAVHIPDEYKRLERTVAYPPPAIASFALEPVTEMSVVRYFPTVEMTPRGPKIAVDLNKTFGTVDDRDEGTPSVRTVRITAFDRNQAVLQALNSFAITPDGQNLVYGVTFREEGDRYYSNLFLRSTNPSNSSVVQLTRGPRFLDSHPVMCREEGSNLVIFQSNRSGINTIDISSFRVQDGRLIGGIQQLTREPQYNIRPTFVSEAQPVFFTSIDDFPQAEPRIASVRTDGSAYTNLGETGSMLNYAESGRIYFARLAPDTQTYQLFSILADGTGIESILNDYAFAQANCHSPAISPDGRSLLFVSDHNADPEARRDNNVWMLDLGGSRQPVQITTNRSDDVAPLWSPTDPGVIYFLSNRRGAYNVWQMTLQSAQ